LFYKRNTKKRTVEFDFYRPFFFARKSIVWQKNFYLEFFNLLRENPLKTLPARLNRSLNDASAERTKSILNLLYLIFRNFLENISCARRPKALPLFVVDRL
jgi:hypothetical protein